MRLFRTDLLPVLTIVAGGIIGASLSFSFLALSPSGDVPALALTPVVGPVPPVAPRPPVESATRASDQAGTLTGRITDASSGSPITAVQVYISSLELGGLSQRNGRYLLRNVPAGTYTLTVARIGYRTTEVQITIGRGQTVEKNFSVAEEAIQLGEIVVTGTPVNIRGYSSITIGNKPLIYVNGVRVDSCQELVDAGRAEPRTCR